MPPPRAESPQSPITKVHKILNEHAAFLSSPGDMSPGSTEDMPKTGPREYDLNTN